MTSIHWMQLTSYQELQVKGSVPDCIRVFGTLLKGPTAAARRCQGLNQEPPDQRSNTFTAELALSSGKNMGTAN